MGPPYENDAIAIRQGGKKVITKGGLAQPWTKDGSQGSAVASVSYNLNVDPYEKEDFSKKDLGSTKIVDRFFKFIIKAIRGN